MLVIITLFSLGILLVLMEIFIPGGVLGALGVVLVVIGVVATFMEYGAGVGSAATIAVMVVGGIALFLWIKYFPRSRMGDKIMLAKTAEDWHGYDTEKAELVGKTGIAHTDLRPSGMVLIEGKRTDVVTRGELIDRDAEVVVVAVEGNRIVVELAEPTAASDAPTPA